jgi:hypothetical protein
MVKHIEFPDLKPEVLRAGDALCNASVSRGLVEGYLFHPNNRRGLAAFLREAVYHAFPGYSINIMNIGTHSILEMANNLHAPPPPTAQEGAPPVYQSPDCQGIGLTPSSSVDIPPVSLSIEEGTLNRIRQALSVAADSAHELAQNTGAGEHHLPLSKVRLRDGFFADQAECLTLLKLLPDSKF